MKVIKRLEKTTEGVDGSLVIRHETKGEPYTEGYEISINDKCSFGYNNPVASVLLERSELEEIRDYLNNVLGE